MKKGLICVAVIALLATVIASVCAYPYGYLKKQMAALEKGGNIRAAVYTKTEDGPWRCQMEVRGEKDRNTVHGVAEIEDNALEFYYDLDDELVFEGFSLCENLAEGLGSYAVPLLEKWVGEVYLSEAQIRGLLEEIGKAEILPEWKSNLIPLENIKVKHCLNKPKAVDMAVNGFWYVINESIYLCMEKGGTEDVMLHIFDEKGTGRIDLRFAKNEGIGTIRMPKTIPDELIFVLKKGYELWNSWQAS